MRLFRKSGKSYFMSLHPVVRRLILDEVTDTIKENPDAAAKDLLNRSSVAEIKRLETIIMETHQ